MPADRLSAVKTALVLDNTGQYEAIAATDYLLGKGVAVTFVSTNFGFAEKVRPTLRDDPALERFYAHNVKLYIRHILAAVKPGVAEIRGVHNPDRRVAIPADIVVAITPNMPLRDLYMELAGEMRVDVVGDARNPRDLHMAMHEGHHAARSLQDIVQAEPIPTEESIQAASLVSA